MKKVIVKLVLAAVLGHLVGGWTFASDSGVEREADKADAVKRIMAGRKFYMGEPEKPFCGQFLKDFRIPKDMSFVEPVARAEHYDDPTLESYKARCGERPLNEKYECDPRATQGVKWSKDPVKKRQQLLRFCHLYTGTANFKVFEIDIDNDPKNGKELIVYFERAIGRDFRGDNIYGNGGYNVFDSRNCALIPVDSTHDPYSYFWKRPLENYNGILFYRDRYYVFDLYELDGSDRDPENPIYRLHISTAGADRSHWCSYSMIPPRTIKPPKKPMKQGGSK